jgi:hypothetical protein
MMLIPASGRQRVAELLGFAHVVVRAFAGTTDVLKELDQ